MHLFPDDKEQPAASCIAGLGAAVNYDK